jgi:hypothetical protein
MENVTKLMEKETKLIKPHHMIQVRPIQDDTGDWYILPNEWVKEFYIDQDDEEFVDSGGFGDKYGKYMTGGDLNNIQLYADINDLK